MPHEAGAPYGSRLTGIGGEKGGIQGDIANIPASNVQARQFVKFKVFDWCIRRKRTSPDFGALRRIGKRELHHKANAPQKCRIQRALQVRRQNRQAAIRLHPLEQVTDFDIRIAIMAVLNLATLAKQRIGFVEQQDRATRLGGVEDAPQILLRLTDVFADDRREIDAIQRSRCNSFASTSAAIVLPVPLAPANSALIPRPRELRAANPQVS